MKIIRGATPGDHTDGDDFFALGLLEADVSEVLEVDAVETHFWEEELLFGLVFSELEDHGALVEFEAFFFLDFL